MIGKYTCWFSGMLFFELNRSFLFTFYPLGVWSTPLSVFFRYWVYLWEFTAPALTPIGW